VGGDPVNFNDQNGTTRWIVTEGMCTVGGGTENSPYENVACLGFTFWSPMQEKAVPPDGGGNAATPRTDWVLMPSALARVIQALTLNTECMNLFGTAQTRQAGFNPVNVLTSIVTKGQYAHIEFVD
jgi:hypothetical protein